MTTHTEQTGRPPHPVVFLVLMLPFGAGAGYVTVTLGYLLAQRGVSAELIATVIAANLLPQTWKFLWAPVIDTMLGPKTWYTIGTALTAVAVFACSLAPATTPGVALLTVLVFLISVATSFISMSIDLLLAQNTREDQKGRASGWFQAGNMAGGGLGGGAALWLAQHVDAPWVSPVVLGGACMLCPLALLRLPAHNPFAGPGAPLRGAAARLREQMRRLFVVLRELWALVRSRKGFLGLLVVGLPIGTGAGSNLWSAVADGWQASADSVALVNGALGGVASGIGALFWGEVCDRMDRKAAYVLAGVAQAAVAVFMALAPHTEWMYIAFTLIYAVTSGMTFAAFSAVAFECVGSMAAATKYNVFASLSNTPILYMSLIEGWAYTAHGPNTMLYAEAGLAAASILVFVAAAAVAQRRARPA